MKSHWKYADIEIGNIKMVFIEINKKRIVRLLFAVYVVLIIYSQSKSFTIKQG
jgi:hypothetical protein